MVNSSKYQLKDTYLGPEKIEIQSTANVQANNSSTKEITAANGEVWIIQAVRLFCANPGTATEGSHQTGFSPTEIGDFSGLSDVYFAIQSNFDTIINLENNSIANGTLEKFDGSIYEANQSINGLAIDDTNGITGYYENNTDAEQTNDRFYTVFVERFEA